MTTPDLLYHGAKVALLCLSSALPDGQTERAAQAVRSLGLEPVIFPSCLPESRHGGFAADDARRAEDLQEAFSDPDLQGILCLGGGYGAGRLLPLINWKAVAHQPKVFCGADDVTALHLVLNQSCKLTTYYTPVLAEEEAETPDSFTVTCLQRALYGALSGPLDRNGCGSSFQSGQARGRLCGGRLSRICDSLGTPWQLNPKGKILFLEDGEPSLSRIDTMLTQLRNAGLFCDCSGILLGSFAAGTTEGQDALRECFEELLLPSEKPILSGLPTGHGLPAMSLPLGAEVFLDADAKILEVLA